MPAAAAPDPADEDWDDFPYADEFPVQDDGIAPAGRVPLDGGPLPEDWVPPGDELLPPGAGRRGYLDPQEETATPLRAWTAEFAEGGVLEGVPAGLALAGFATEARDGVIDDDELIGVIRTWRRLASWASAGELEAIAALARRRPIPGNPLAGPDEELPPKVGEFVADEIEAALTLTPVTASLHTDLAFHLAERLRPVRDSLAAGWIDLPRARLFHTATLDLTDEHAAAVVAAVLPEAPDMTTGRLRRALDRAVLATDPDAARRSREVELKNARVECWPNPSGTGNLAGRYLPSADTLAAANRLDAIARSWKDQGATGALCVLRARAFLHQLLGRDPDSVPTDLLPPETPPADPSRLPPLAGSVNLTIPLTTLLGLSEAPGEGVGYGPLDPDTARELACAAAGHRATRWHITVTGPTGRALGHGSVTGGRRSASGGSGWQVSVTAEPIAAGCCDHRNQEPQYRPSPGLQRLIWARTSTCSYFGCGRDAVRCDLDHSVPYDDGGITCECNLAPLCRHHHRMKQDQAWKLEHITPGVMAWLTPAGRRYITLPSQHPT